MDIKDNIKNAVRQRRYEYDKQKFIISLPLYVLPNCKDNKEKQAYYKIFKGIGIAFLILFGIVSLYNIVDIIKDFSIDNIIFLILSGILLILSIFWLKNTEKGMKMSSEDSDLLADKFIQDSDNI